MSSCSSIRYIDLCGGLTARASSPVQVTIYRRIRIGRHGHLDQAEAYDIYRNLYENTGPGRQAGRQAKQYIT